MATHPAPRGLLLVDDDPDELDLLEAAVAPLGLETVLARDGEEAARLVEQRRFAAVVTDLVMPRLNGFETVARIRRSPNGRDLPVIVLTGFDADGARGLPGWDAVGSQVDYLEKPFSPDALRRKVAAHASRH